MFFVNSAYLKSAAMGHKTYFYLCQGGRLIGRRRLIFILLLVIYDNDVYVNYSTVDYIEHISSAAKETN